jgi:hypothetical protein
LSGRRLSGKFYSIIPHSIGTNQSHLAHATIDSHYKIQEKRQVLQRMKDIQQVCMHSARMRTTHQRRI